MAERGYNYLVQVDTGTDSWDALRIRGGNFPEINQNHGTVDITAHGDSDLPWRTHLLTLYEAQNPTVNVLSGGSTSQQTALSFVQGKIGDEDGIELRLIDGSETTPTAIWQGTYLVTGFTLQAPLEDALSYNVSLMLNGEPTVHFGS